jgi:hypothetical protein
MQSPSVFNFYPPDYIPPGTELASMARFAPELRLYNDVTAMAVAERILTDLVIPEGVYESGRYDDWRLLSSTPATLVSALNDELMYGTLSDEAQQIIIDALGQIFGSTDRVRTAVWLIANSPEFRVLR